MSGSSPGWTYNFVPTQAQWNAAFAGKQDVSAVLTALIAQGGAPSFFPPTSWTPVDGSGATLTFTSVSAEYAVVGNLVLASAKLTYPSTASGSSAIIGGLPYGVPSAGYASAPMLGYVTGAAAVLMLPVGGSSNIAIMALASGAAVVNSTLSLKTISFQMAFPLL
jgi:hypothetical protein